LGTSHVTGVPLQRLIKIAQSEKEALVIHFVPSMLLQKPQTAKAAESSKIVRDCLTADKVANRVVTAHPQLETFPIK
jgi:hypothetical protein